MKGFIRMEGIDVDAKGLDPKLCVNITKRAMSMSSGKPVRVVTDNAASKEAIRSFAELKRWNVTESSDETGCEVLIISS